MRPYAFGVDIGGTAIKLGLFRTNGRLTEKWSIPTRTENSGGNVLPDVVASLNQVLKRRGLDWDQIEGVGMGVPGPVREDGTVMGCVNLGWDVFNIPRVIRGLEPRIDRFCVTNDVNAATLGEMWQGGAEGRKSAFMVTLGTGIGGGLVINEQIVNGDAGGAGEIGHFRVERGETEPCKCGGYGCLEQYCSATGLVRCARRALVKDCHLPTALQDDENLSALSICNAAKTGDELASELLDQLGDRLGWALTAVAGTTNPEVFVVGGGMSNAGNLLLERIEQGFRRHSFHACRDTEFSLAQLGNDAGIYGCVRMLL